MESKTRRQDEIVGHVMGVGVGPGPDEWSVVVRVDEEHARQIGGALQAEVRLRFGPFEDVQ